MTRIAVILWFLNSFCQACRSFCLLCCGANRHSSLLMLWFCLWKFQTNLKLKSRSICIFCKDRTIQKAPLKCRIYHWVRFWTNQGRWQLKVAKESNSNVLTPIYSQPIFPMHIWFKVKYSSSVEWIEWCGSKPHLEQYHWWCNIYILPSRWKTK